MSDLPRQMHLAVFVVGTGNHSEGWRHEGAFASNADWDVQLAIARTAERGKFDLFFNSDGVTVDPTDQPSFLSRFEPTALLAALSKFTSHIGLGATVSTSFSEPFHVARVFSTLDHLSGGRAAWNIVTTIDEKAAYNFSKDPIPHDLRYEIANEFVDVVRGLWNCWEEGAILADRTIGRFSDPSKIHHLNHQGRFFQVRGPVNIERSPQHQPVLIHAGGSPPGRDLAARVADVVFTVVYDPDLAKQAYDALKDNVARYGRDPDDLKVLSGVMPIIGGTEQEAKEQLDLLQSWLSDTSALTLVSKRLGHDIAGYPLDGPIPDFPEETQRGQSFASTLLGRGRREGLKLRDLYNLVAAAHGHWVVCGTAEQIADTLQEWYEARRTDGYIIMPAYFPGAFDDFVDQVVPILQERGVFRRDYTGTTFLDHLGISRDRARAGLVAAK